MKKSEYTKELIDSAINGDKEARAFLYSSGYQQVYNTIFSVLNNHQDTEDVTQETFIKAFNSLQSLQKPQSFISWIKKIAYNKARDYTKRKRILGFDDLADEEGYEIEFSGPRHYETEFLVSEHQDKKILNKMLSKLTREQRMAVVLNRIEGYTMKAIAQIQNCSENTIKSRVRTAEKKMTQEAEKFKKQGYTLGGLAPMEFFTYAGKACGLSSSSLSAGAFGSALATTSIVKRVVAVACSVVLIVGGAVGGKMAYDKYKENIAMNIDENYISTLLALTHNYESDNYNNLSDENKEYILDDIPRNMQGYRDGVDLITPTKQEGEYLYFSIENMNHAFKEMLGIDLNSLDLDDEKEGKNYKLYSMGTGTDRTLKIHNKLYNKENQRVIVYYMYNDGRSSAQIDYNEEPMGSLSYNKAEFELQDSKDYPLKLISNQRVDIEDYSYKGKTVDFGDYTLDVPDDWTYKIVDDELVYFYGAGIDIEMNYSGKLMVIRKLNSDEDDSGNTEIAQSLIDIGENTYHQIQVTDVRFYIDSGESELSREWSDKYNFAYFLMEKAWASFELKEK